MSEGWSSPDESDLDDIDAWMARRNAQAALRPAADAFARNLWNQSTQAGDDLYAGNPSDLAAIGLAALGNGQSFPAIAANDDDQVGDSASSHQPSMDAGAELSPQDDGEAAENSDQTSAYPLAANAGFRGQSPQQSKGENPNGSSSSEPWVSEVDVVAPPATSSSHDNFLESLNHNSVARALAGVSGYMIGLPGGVLRGGWDALKGVSHGLNFVGSLFCPKGLAEDWNGAKAVTHNALQYGRSVRANPSRLTDDAISKLQAANRSLNPVAIPVPETASGVFGHELGIGANGGEALTNIAGLFAAPEFFGGVTAARGFAATREANVADMTAGGLNEPTATYLSKAYRGQGDHVIIPQDQSRILGFKTPRLKDVTIPDWIMNSPLNVSKPRGMSQGDFYDYHYAVDPDFHGAKLPFKINGGKGWSGRRTGAERYTGAKQLWARTPQIWKDPLVGTALGDSLGWLSDDDGGARQ